MKMWVIGGVFGWLWGLAGLTLVSSTALHPGILKIIGISLLYLPAVFASTVFHPFAPPDFVAMNNYVVWITIPFSGALMCAGLGYVYETVRDRVSSKP